MYLLITITCHFRSITIVRMRNSLTRMRPRLRKSGRDHPVTISARQSKNYFLYSRIGYRRVVAVMEVFIARFDYQKEREDLLSFKEGEKFRIASKADKKWWAAYSETGDYGYIPSSYMEVRYSPACNGTIFINLILYYLWFITFEKENLGLCTSDFEY